MTHLQVLLLYVTKLLCLLAVLLAQFAYFIELRLGHGCLVVETGLEGLHAPSGGITLGPDCPEFAFLLDTLLSDTRVILF